VSRDCFPSLRRDDKRGNWIPACSGMTDKALFIRVLEKNGDRLYFLSGTKCERTKEDCPHFKITPSGMP